MLVVIQVAYASLLTSPSITPLQYALTSLSPATNGYNILYSYYIRPFEDTLTPSKMKGINVYSQFLYNFNAGIVIILVPLILGLVLFIVDKVMQFE